MTTEERNKLIAKIAALPGEIEAAVKGLNDSQLDTPYGPGKWTLRQVVHHLADAHITAFYRCKLVLTEDHPTIKPYNQDLWATLPDTIAAPIEPSLLIVRGVHDRWSRLLRSVPETAWSRLGHHIVRGDVTLESLLGIYAEHGEKHVGTITSLRRTKGW
jgi:hypothetical protein